MLDAPVRFLLVQPHTGFVSAYTTAQTVSSGFSTDGNLQFGSQELPTNVTCFTSLGNTLLYPQPDGGLQQASLPSPNRWLCQPGYVQTPDLLQCLQVPVGYWSDSWEFSSMKACPAGTFGPSAGAVSATECLPCPPGTFSSEVAQSECQACPPDEPLRSADGTACATTCAAGSVQNGSQSCRACDAGSTVVGTQCVPCAVGSYSNSSTHFLCLACANGWTSPQGASHCIRTCTGAAQCGNEAHSCVAKTYDYKMLNAVLLPTHVPATAVAAYPAGGVLYSDGSNVYHYADRCTGANETCTMQGTGLLAPGAYSAIQALEVTPELGADQTRTVYFAEPTRIYSLSLAYQGGVLKAAIASVKVVAGAETSGCVGARFQAVTDLALSEDGTLLYVCDWMCSAIRVVDLATGSVQTVVRERSNADRPVFWGSTQSDCVVDCAGLYRPKGIALSPAPSPMLYITLPDLQYGSVAQVDLQQQRMVLLCSQNSATGPLTRAGEGCTGGRKCNLHAAKDVLYTDSSLLVTTGMGVTKIDLNTLACDQLAGAYFGMNSAASGDQEGVQQLPPAEAQTNQLPSRLSSPVHIAYNAQTGVLYVGDWQVGKVRRIYVDGRCRCNVGSVYVSWAQSCYRAEPAPVLCARNTYFSTAAQECVPCTSADTVQMACISVAAQAALFSLTPQLLQNPNIPNNALQDWYGEKSNGDGTPEPFRVCGYTCDSVAGAFEMYTDTTTMYRPRERAPLHTEFTSLTLVNGAWMPEQRSAKQPVRVLPGLWYPCMPASFSSPSAARCFRTIGFFEAPASHVWWEQHRWEASTYRARTLDSSDYVGIVRGTAGTVVSAYSRYFLWERGPTLWHETSDPHAAFLDGILYALKDAAFGYVGWPAVYACPSGYTWVALGKLQQSVACLSCVPGTYSRRDQSLLGGPYACTRCPQGSYSTAVGAEECVLCEIGKYANTMGSTACTLCPQATSTDFAGALSILNCRNCTPGTGNCLPCAPGEYQPVSGRTSCLRCRPGSFSKENSSAYCTPCAVNQYQPFQGQSSCLRCAATKHTNHMSGTVQESGCLPCTSSCPLDCADLACGVNRWLDIVTYNCSSCPKGELSVDQCSMSTTSCESAAQGYYMAGNQIAVCASGQESNFDRDSCVNCMDGMWSYVEDVQGCSGTKCNAGHSCAGGVMRACDPGTFTATSGYSVCTMCAPGKVAPAQVLPLHLCFLCVLHDDMCVLTGHDLLPRLCCWSLCSRNWRQRVSAVRCRHVCALCWKLLLRNMQCIPALLLACGRECLYSMQQRRLQRSQRHVPAMWAGQVSRRHANVCGLSCGAGEPLGGLGRADRLHPLWGAIGICQRLPNVHACATGSNAQRQQLQVVLGWTVPRPLAAELYSVSKGHIQRSGRTLHVHTVSTWTLPAAGGTDSL